MASGKKGTFKEHECTQCGDIFRNHNSKTKFCSRKCFYDSRKKDMSYTCIECGAVFQNKHKEAMFCGRKCSGINLGKKMQGKKQKSPTKKTRILMSKSQKGENGNNWQGGKTEKSRVLRQSVYFKIWREKVFTRDNWTCRHCNIRGGTLHPHHIKEWAQYPKLRFIIDNGLTLCKECHQILHSKQLSC